VAEMGCRHTRFMIKESGNEGQMIITFRSV
jgi:hypothetical protein